MSCPGRSRNRPDAQVPSTVPPRFLQGPPHVSPSVAVLFSPGSAPKASRNPPRVPKSCPKVPSRFPQPAACCLLPAACRLPPAACHLLPAACCLLPAACCLLPAACCLLQFVLNHGWGFAGTILIFSTSINLDVMASQHKPNKPIKSIHTYSRKL